jgi:AbrB family looped-hinge helix DNA binding protein
MEIASRITSKGQVTIPAGIREKAGLLPNTEVDFSCDKNGTVRIFKAAKQRKSRGERLVAHLRAHPGDVTMTTDEIMKLTRGDKD